MFCNQKRRNSEISTTAFCPVDDQAMDTFLDTRNYESLEFQNFEKGKSFPKLH